MRAGERGSCRRFRGAQRLDWAGQCVWEARGERGMRDGQRWQRHTSANTVRQPIWPWPPPGGPVASRGRIAGISDRLGAQGAQKKQGPALGFGVSRRRVWQIYMRRAVWKG